MTEAQHDGTPTSPDDAPAGYEWPGLAHLPLTAFVTTRAGGVSQGPYTSLNLGLHVGDDPAAVAENRRRALAAVGADLADAVFAQQVHGAGVAVVTQEHRGRGAFDAADAVPGVDALVTTIPDLVLVIMVADCVPLVLFDPVQRVLAAVHAGWPGTVGGIARAAVAAMRDLGTDPANIVAGIGPSVDPLRYQVGVEVAEAARVTFGDRFPDVVRPDGQGKWLFDLWAANESLLVEAGVPTEQIFRSGLVTGPQTPFYSHRFEGPTGRFALLARIDR